MGEGEVILTFAYSRPQATKNGLHTEFLWWRGVEQLESGLVSWNDCFCDADSETK